MKIFGKLISPAVFIIGVMILINAGVILYYAQHFDESDQNLQNNVQQVEKVADQNRKIIAAQTQERVARSNQSCELFETDHLQDVQQLRQTYRYLISLTPEERQEPLNRFVLINLPDAEQQALVDRAPEYCDGEQPNGDDIGLPEPDPKVPDRPAELVKIIGPRPNYPSPTEIQKNHTSTLPKNGLQDLRNK